MPAQAVPADVWEADTSADNKPLPDAVPANEWEGTNNQTPGNLQYNQAFGIFNPDDPATIRLKAKLGPAYDPSGFVAAPGDVYLAAKMGYADSLDKKQEEFKKAYPQGDYQVYDFGDDGKKALVTKDGKTWNNFNPLPELPGSFPYGEVAGGLLFAPSAEAGIIRKVGQMAAGSALGKGAEELGAKALGYYESERDPVLTKMSESFATNAAFGALTEGVIGPFLRRTIGVKGTPGAEKAATSAAELGLEPLTRGQYTSSGLLQASYAQYQNYVIQSRAEALKRFQSLGDNLHDFVNQYGIDNFGSSQLQALRQASGDQIDKTLIGLSKGKTRFDEVLPGLKNALNTFNSSASALKNKAYEDAFDTANTDMVSLDFKRVNDAFDEIEKGVPVVSKSPADTGISDAMGAVGVGEGPPVRYLTPEAELQAKIDKARNVSNVLYPHNPDGNYVSALQQMNAIRRDFSQFAWDNAGSIQGQKAEDVLKAIDDSIAHPVAGETPDYKAAYKAAQDAHAAWRAALEIKKVSALNESDVGTYQAYIANLMKPGNGPVLELMDKMFKGTPKAMDDIRSTFVDQLTTNPGALGDTLDNLAKKDPAMLKMIFPNEADIPILKKFGEEKNRLDSSWFVKQADSEYVSEGQRVLGMLAGKPEEVGKRLADYIHFAGPDGKLAIQSALIEKLRDESETIATDELGSSVVSATPFVAAVNKYRPLIEQVFSPDAITRLNHLENYALKIRETAVGVPEVASSMESSAGDMGTSLAVASQAGKLTRGIATAEKSKGGMVSGIAHVVKDLVFSSHISPRVVAAIVGFDKPVGVGGKEMGRMAITEDRLQAIKNYLKVAPSILLDSASRYGTGQMQSDQVNAIP